MVHTARVRAETVGAASICFFFSRSLDRFPGLSGGPQLASMTPVSEIAKRYANALFDLADEQGLLDTVAGDLARIISAVDESTDLQRVLRSPVLDRDAQGKALKAILEAMEVSELTRNFVGLIAQNRRLFALTAMIDGFLSELARRRGEITAEVTAAKPLTDAQIKSLQDTLQNSIGGKVTVAPQVDPGLIGGLIVRVGSQMVDTSLRTQLNKMQLAMKGAS